MREIGSRLGMTVEGLLSILFFSGMSRQKLPERSSSCYEHLYSWVRMNQVKQSICALRINNYHMVTRIIIDLLHSVTGSKSSLEQEQTN